MYESCVTCPKAGVSCREPRITDMTIEEAIVLMKARKKFLGYSNQYIADHCTPKMAKGTIDGIFAATHADFRFETIRPAWNVLFGGNVPDNPCPGLSDNERVKYEEKIIQLEKEISWRDDTIKRIEKNNASMETLITNTNKRHTESQNFMREQIRNRNTTVVSLATCLGICVLLIIGALIVDGSDPTKGFLYLDDGLQPNAVFVLVCTIALIGITQVVIRRYFKHKYNKNINPERSDGGNDSI